MRQIITFALMFCLAFPAWPQEPAGDPPPPPPDEEVQEPPRRAPQPQEMGYYDNCFGVPRPGAGRFGISGEVIVPIGGPSGGGGAPSSPVPVSGPKDDKLWLVVAVLAVAALPVVIYAVDKPAPRLVLQRFQCPTFSFDILGGADNGRATLGGGSAGFLTTRFTFGVSHLASDFQYDGAPRGVSGFSAHLLLRPTPREHVEGGLAIGFRRSVLGDRIEGGFEIGLPHRYALWRDGLRTFGLELRPLLQVGTRLEPSLEGAFLIPLAQVLHLRVGGRVYTFEGDLLWGLAAGLSLTL
jgi:hypothetical protein